QQTLIFGRFFDEAGGMQLVIHSPVGSRINRAWGLALRKRFCRSFNFELQAAATEDTIVLSLTTAHSFERAEVARYLHSITARSILVQAVCAAPMFPVRWRWSAAIALALPRFRGGKKVPAPLARMAAEDLLAAVFPDQLACAENLPGEVEIPDHPLVRQTLRDCLEEAMDAGGFERLLLFAALFPAARPEPAVTTPAGRAQTVSGEAALVEAVRGRLEGLGPTTAAALAAELALPTSRIETALAALQAEGFAMRGAFTDTPPPEGEWCERRLLARIHGYTVKRLRAEIEPIEARDFVRFLLDWQRVTPALRMEGPDAVGAVLAQLEGFEAPAS